MKLINKFLCVAFLVCHVSVSQSQSQTLTEKQMKDDLLFLQGHIHKYFSPLTLLEQRTGIEFDKEFNKLENEITSITSIEEFAQIIRQGLNMLNDGHSQIIPKFSLKNYITPNYYLSSIGNASLSDTTNADYYYRLITERVNLEAKTNIMTKFINGEYYNVRPFVYNGIQINAGEIIKTIDGIPMNEFVKENLSKMYYLSWDPISKKHYTRLFTMALPLLGMETFTLTIGDKDIELELSEAVENLQERHVQSNYGNVMLIDNSILYIRMPEMSNLEWYIKELLSVYTVDVEKIIIDVRGNPGGNDGVWNSLLRKIIDEPLNYKFHVEMNHNDSIENSVLSAFSELSMIRKGDKTEIYTETVLTPDSNSVHFKGKLYVFQDEFSYSAATALSSVAWQNENIELVGAPSAFIGGYTLPAIAFKLPNSGIVFTLAFSTDIVGGEENPYMDKVKVEILDNNIDAFVDKIMNNDCYSKDYLLNKDKLIQYVREK